MNESLEEGADPGGAPANESASLAGTHGAPSQRSRERVLVLLGASAPSARLVRLVRRLGRDERAPVVALHVDPGLRLTPQEARIREQHLELARTMGAELVQTTGDFFETLTDLVRRRRITQVVLEVGAKRSWLRRVLGGPTLQERLSVACPGVDLHLVPDRESEVRRLFAFPRPQAPLRDYLVAFAATATATGLNLLMLPFTGYWAPSLFYLFALLLLATRLGRGPLLLTASLSALLWNFLFIPPRFTFLIARFEDTLMLIAYFAVAAITGQLGARLRSKQLDLARREETMAQLFELTRDLSQATTIAQVHLACLPHFEKEFGPAVLYVAYGDTLRRLSLLTEPAVESEREEAVSHWVWKVGRSAGRYTDTLSDARRHFVPLLTPKGVLGAMAVKLEAPPDTARQNLLGAMTTQVALAIERCRLLDQEKELRAVEESERLYRVLLSSLSHELRSPLTAILGASTALQNDRVAKQPTLRRGLIEELSRSATRMDRLIRNLLDMSRLEAGRLERGSDRVDIRELLRDALDGIQSDLEGHNVQVEFAGTLPSVSVDRALLVEGITTIIHNAIVHTPEGTSIRIKTKLIPSGVSICVSDNGPGVPAEALPRLFDKFFRVRPNQPGGIGLGLAIARGIVELHGGRISAEPSAEGGLAVIVELPAAPGE